MRRDLRGRALLSALALFFLPTIAFALPDLTVTQSDIQFSVDSPEITQVITISATIRNNGDPYHGQVVPTPFDSHTVVHSEGGFAIHAMYNESPAVSPLWVSQLVLSTETVYVGKASFRVYDKGSDDSITLEVRQDGTGTRPGTGSSNLMDTVNLNSDCGPDITDNCWEDFTLSQPLQFLANTTYWFCLESVNPSSANAYGVVRDYDLSLSSEVTFSRNLGAWWDYYTGMENRNIFFKAFRPQDTIIKLYNGDPLSGGTLLKTATVPLPLPTSSTTLVSTTWSAPSSGTYNIYVEVDGAGLIQESDDLNNKDHKSIEVRRIVPVISVSTPSDGLTNVEPNVVLSFEFDWPSGLLAHDMDTGTLEAAFNLVPVEDEFGQALSSPAVIGNFQGGVRTATFTPTAALLPNTKYEARWSATAYDNLGTSITATTISFWTSSRAVVTAISPGNSAVNVETNQPLVFSFSRDMQEATVENISAFELKAIENENGQAISSVVSGTMVYDPATRRASFSPASILLPNSLYQAAWSSFAEDTLGNTVAVSTFTFRTAVRSGVTVYSPSDGSVAVAIQSPLTFTFSRAMNSSTLAGAFQLQAIRDAEGNTVQESVSGDMVYDAVSKTATFTSTAPLKNHYRYRASWSAAAIDSYGLGIVPSCASFETVNGPGNRSRIVGSDGKTEVIIQPGALTYDSYFVDLRVSPSVTQVIQVANGKTIRDKDAFARPIISSLRRLTLFEGAYPGQEVISPQFAVPVTLKIPYSDNGNGFVLDTSPPVKEDNLSMYWLNETDGLWVRLPDSEVDTTQNLVTARVPHFSYFIVMGFAANDLSRAYAYPVPFRPNAGLGHTKIKFAGLSPQCIIKIYTVTGDLVRTIEESDGDGFNDSWDGSDVASGTYLYIIDNAVEKKTGTLVIVK